jgi:hypothetical protein
VAKVARPITVVLSLLLFVALALTAASELSGSGPVPGASGLASAPLGGDAPHDCHQVPLHGAHYVASGPSARPHQAPLTSGDSATSASATLWHAATRLAAVRDLGPSGRDLRARCSAPVLQVFRT